MTDQEQGTERPGRSLLDEIRKLRADADKNREPELLSARLGTRRISLAALIERVVDAFIDEHAGGSPALKEADTENKRIKLILATVDYVLAVDSVQITNDDKAELIRKAYTELFTYGPLDALFEDEAITTIALEGADKTSVRYGHGDLQSLKPIFEDEGHLRKIIHRLLLDSGAALTEDNAIIETGLRVNGRTISLNLVGPPVTYVINVDIRLHPVVAPTLESMIEAQVFGETAADLLRALARSPHGLMIIGESESGKTSLLSALIPHMDEEQRSRLVSVERAGEIRLPETARQLVVRWGTPEQEAIPFGARIQEALGMAEISCLLLDEIRADEAPAILPLLSDDNLPRQIWAVRGPTDSNRLSAALGMLARRSGESPADAEHLVRALYERLPFAITLRRRKGRLQLMNIAEWQFSSPDEDYPRYVELMGQGWDGLEVTGSRPAHTLDLPDDFWQKES